MCRLPERALFLRCQFCKDRTAHLLERAINCRKTRYTCAGCGRINGYRVVG